MNRAFQQGACNRVAAKVAEFSYICNLLGMYSSWDSDFIGWPATISSIICPICPGTFNESKYTAQECADSPCLLYSGRNCKHRSVLWLIVHELHVSWSVVFKRLQPVGNTCSQFIIIVLVFWHVDFFWVLVDSYADRAQRKSTYQKQQQIFI